MLRKRRSLRFTKGMDATPLRPIARHRGEQSDGGSEGMALRDLADVRRHGDVIEYRTASPLRSARWNEEMDERVCPAQPRDWVP